MRDSSLRWGIGLGVTAAAIGIVGRLIGVVLAPIPVYTTAESVAVALIVQTFVVLLSLGGAFALAHYAGQRTERDRRQRVALQAEEGQAEASAAADDRSGSMLAGGIVMLCYWFLTTLYQVVVPIQQGASTTRPNLLAAVISGVLFVLFGIGMGGLGARTVAARALLRGVIKPASVAVPPVAAAPVATPTTPAAPTTSAAPTAPATSAEASVEATPAPSAPVGTAAPVQAAVEETAPVVGDAPAGGQ